jgi:hypothetical protein
MHKLLSTPHLTLSVSTMQTSVFGVDFTLAELPTDNYAPHPSLDMDFALSALPLLALSCNHGASPDSGVEDLHLRSLQHLQQDRSNVPADTLQVKLPALC